MSNAQPPQEQQPGELLGQEHSFPVSKEEENAAQPPEPQPVPHAYQDNAQEEAVQHQAIQQQQVHYIHQHLLYAQQDHGHHHAQVHQQEHHAPQPEAHHEQQPHETEIQHQQPQGAHIQHDPNIHHPSSAGIVMPASFAQQLMDPHMNQQQLAQYHQQIAQFQPQAYQQQLAAQYHPGHLQEVPPLYFAQGIPPQQLQQAYQDAANAQEAKIPDMSIDEAAAAHLTALRNTGRPEGQIADGQPPAGVLGPQGMTHPHLHGLPEGAGRDSYAPPNAQALLAATVSEVPVQNRTTPLCAEDVLTLQCVHNKLRGTIGAKRPTGTCSANKSVNITFSTVEGPEGRVPSKRKAWRASHEGQGAEVVEQTSDGARQRRKQTRRPDRLCHHEGCFVTPTYNYPNEKKRIFCVTHKLDGMVNVVAKRCAHPDCAVNPRFNYEGNPRGMYCSEHKLEGMVNVIDRRCQEPDCKKFPSHNYPGSHKKLYCASHKKEGMVDMSHGSN